MGLLVKPQWQRFHQDKITKYSDFFPVQANPGNTMKFQSMVSVSFYEVDFKNSLIRFFYR